MSSENSFKITFLCWNVVKAECCTSSHFPYVDDVARDWYCRFALFQQFLTKNDVDFLYLMDVDRYQHFFAPLLAELQYRVIVDGNCDIVAYKNDKIIIPRKENVFFSVGTQSFVCLDILPFTVVFCVHLEEHVAYNADIRPSQIKQLLNHTAAVSSQHTVIIMGTFNDHPASETIRCVEEAGFDCLNASMSFTFFKRAEIVERSVNDYVFVRRGSPSFLKEKSTVRTYDESVMKCIDPMIGLPNEFIPSCHLPLISELCFRARVVSFS